MKQNQPLKILVVDDEEGIVDYTVKTYAMKGFTTFSATDGITAVEVFRKERPLVTLIDVHMPFSPIDGIETLRRIKEIDKKAVCIMVTRIAEKKEVETAKEYGASAYLVKPCAMDDLDKVIEEVAKIKLKD